MSAIFLSLILLIDFNWVINIVAYARLTNFVPA